MATEQHPVNGSFAPVQTQAYTIDQHAGSDSAPAPLETNGAATGDIPKDEVGWYFVEQYYTTLSKNPEKLYLFYNKRSQFVSGSETEKVNVCVGQKAIDERIKALDIQDCKVRVTNVDSQGSGQNIVIQVIGEMSNKTTPRTKFTQTFVLAEQTNGYFVLNDIFRYIVDDEEEAEGEESAPAVAEPATDASAEPLTLTNSQNPQDREREAQLIDQGIEAAISHPETSVEAPAAAVNGTEPVEVVVAAEEAPVAATAVEDDVATVDVDTVASPQEAHGEKPPAPQSTPAPAASPKPATSQPAAAPKPAVPKTWANLVAAGQKVPTAAAAAAAQAAPAPAAPAAQPKTSPAAAQPVAPAQAPSGPAAQETEQPDTAQSSGSEWQTAQQHHGKKQQRPQSTASPVANSRAYMKNISEGIDEETLRAALSKHGELTYLDINRGKNCAFADFATPQAYQAAVAANPHEVAGERVFVEERRVRPQSGHFGPGFQGRGGMPTRGGRGGSVDRSAGGQGRGGFPGGKDGQRGNFAGRGRANGPRGRGVSQAA